jgi:hypothetical protein
LIHGEELQIELEIKNCGTQWIPFTLIERIPGVPAIPYRYGQKARALYPILQISSRSASTDLMPMIWNALRENAAAFRRCLLQLLYAIIVGEYPCITIKGIR